MTRNDTTVYITHPTMTLTIKHLIILQHTGEHHHISHRIIYHYLRISTQLILISHDRSMIITIDNTIFTLTPRETNTTATQHTNHVFLNLCKGSLYL